MHSRDEKIYAGIFVGLLVFLLLTTFIGELLEAIALRLSYGFLSSVMALALEESSVDMEGWQCAFCLPIFLWA